MFRLLKWIALSLAVIVVVGVPALVGVRPFIGPKARPLSDRRFEPTQARIDRGKYLVEPEGPVISRFSDFVI